MVRCILPAFFLGASADESLMQFEKASELSGGMTHTLAMQRSTQKMVDSYQKLVQDIVNAGSLKDPVTGRPYVPTQSILDNVRGEFNSIEDELKNQQSTNQGILDAHDATVKACNTARADAFAGADGVVAKMTAMQNARTTHRTCRNLEDQQIDSMETECGKFQNQDRCGPKQDQNWYHDNAQKGAFTSSLREIINQAKTCRTKVADVTATAATCDANQDTFMQAFCTYESALQATCTELDNCYSVAKENKDTADTSISKLEEEQKIMWRMVQKVHCFLDILFSAAAEERKVPQQADIDKCMAMDYTSNADANLNLGYTNAETKDLCIDNPAVVNEPASDTFRPGAVDWENAELFDYAKHGKLKDVDAC